MVEPPPNVVGVLLVLVPVLFSVGPRPVSRLLRRAVGRRPRGVCRGVHRNAVLVVLLLGIEAVFGGANSAASCAHATSFSARARRWQGLPAGLGMCFHGRKGNLKGQDSPRSLSLLEFCCRALLAHRGHTRCQLRLPVHKAAQARLGDSEHTMSQRCRLRAGGSMMISFRVMCS